MKQSAMKILFIVIIMLMDFSVHSQVPKLKNQDIWKSLYPRAQKFDNKGRLTKELRASSSPAWILSDKTSLAHIFYYKKNNLNKAAVVLFTFEYEGEVRIQGHPSVAIVSIATFTLLSNNKWTKTKFVEDWIIPQFGYGIDPPLQLKNYKNTTCLYLKYDGYRLDEPSFYEYYYDIESLDEIKWIEGPKIKHRPIRK